MKIGEIDLDLKPLDYKLKLFKPNRTESLGFLKDINDVVYKLNSGKVNELSFSIPAKIERNHELIDNPMIDRIKHRYLIEFNYKNERQWFVFLKENKSFTNDGETIKYDLLGTGQLIADKVIRGYTAESKNLYDMVTDILGDTSWTISYMHPDFINKYRQHEIASQNALESLYEISEKFNAIVIWDTVNESIRFELPYNLGMNKGLKLKEGKYLESFDVNTDSTEIVTRLRVYGSEGLTFRKLTPTGVNYLEDFSYFMYPFERDVNGNIVQHSHYMSDSLCIALEEYAELLSDNQGQFNTLQSQLTTQQDELQQLEQQLSLLDTELTTLLDQLDVLNQAGEGGTAQHDALLSSIDAKNLEITNKESEITSKETQIQFTENQLVTLRNIIAIENNLNPEQLLELNYFVIEKDYTNDTIVDEEDLLEDGIRAFEEVRIPKLSVNMSLYNFLENVESQHDWKKLNLHDTITLYSQRLKVEIEARIIEIQFNLTNKDVSLTIANELEISDNTEKLLDMIYNSNTTSTQVNLDKWKWNLIEEANTMVNQMYYGNIEAARQKILAGFQQNVTIDERGIRVRSPQNEDEMIIMQNGLLALSKNGGRTWSTAITPDGVTAETLIGKLLIGEQLLIEDENGIIRIQGSLMTVFDELGNPKIKIGEYETGKYGMSIDGGSLEIIGGLTPSHISEELREDLEYDDTFLRSELRLTAPLPTNLTLNGEGITASTSGNTNNFARLDYRGLYIQGGALEIRTSSTNYRGVVFDSTGIRGYDIYGSQTFALDTNGSFFAVDGIFSGDIQGSTITSSEIFSNHPTAGTLSITGGYIQSLSPSGNTEATLGAGSLNISSGNDYVNINSQRINVTSDSFINTFYNSDGINSNASSYSIVANVKIIGSLDLSNASVSNLNATTLNGYSASQFAFTNHSHSQYSLNGHTHSDYIRAYSVSQYGVTFEWNSQGTMIVRLPSGSTFNYTKSN